MPNWAVNTVQFASKEDAERAKNFLSTEESDFDFNRIAPMPPSLYVMSTSVYLEGEYVWTALEAEAGRELDREEVLGLLREKGLPKASATRLVEHAFSQGRKEAPVVPTFGFDQKGFPEELRPLDAVGYGRTLIENMVRWGYPDWYTWRVANWGVKWNAGEVSWCGSSCTFDTPWNGVLEIVLKMSEALGVRVHYEFSEEQFDWLVGEWILDSGNVIAGAHCEPGTLDAFKVAARAWDCDQDSHRWSTELGRIVCEDEEGFDALPLISLETDILSRFLKETASARKRSA